MKTNNLSKLFEKRQKIRQQERRIGVDTLDENEKAMLEFIASREQTRITDISNEHYFDSISLSTIKRGVLTLKQDELVRTITTTDGRECAMALNTAEALLCQ